MKKPTISIIIPVLTINDYLLKENFPAHSKIPEQNFEVIVLPNKKTTSDHKLEKKYRWLRIIATGKVTRPAMKRDIGAKAALGEILAFIDDDAYPAKDWLKQAIKIFNKNKVQAICGPGVLPQSAPFWEKVFDEVLKTWLGSGGYGYRFTAQKRRFVDDYPSMNFLIKRDIFFKLGGFNSDYWPGEDSKLCEDFVYKLSGKILYHPQVLIYHHRRDKLDSFLKQHGQYGFHRGAFFAHGDRNSRRIGYLIPSFFLLYLIFVVLPVNFHFLFYLPLFLYLFGLLMVVFSAFGNTKSILVAMTAPMVLLLTHIVYGLQFIRGFIVGMVKKEQIY